MSFNALPHKQRGVTLIELMIGLTVGALIMAGAMTLFAKISFSGLENVRMVRLNEQLRSTLDVIRRDLQRAGYVDAWEAGVATEIGDLEVAAMDTFGTITLGGACADGDGDGADECDCITYSYDRNRDFAQTADEIFGFQHNGTEVRRDTSAAVCGGGIGWEGVTDGEVNIEVLTFELDPSSTIVEVGDGNDDGVCESGEICLARRKINVVLEGSLSADADFTVRLREEIKVKNDHYYTMP